jgi:hypothetical protein
MAKIKRQKASEVKRKAEKARAFADSGYAEYETEKAAMNLSRGPEKGLEKIPLLGTRYPNRDESAAAKLMQSSRAAELERSALRAQSAERRAEEKATRARRNKALTGRTAGGITKKGGTNVNPTYNTY